MSEVQVAYPFEDLGSHGFQDLAAALAVAVFGPTVQVMGVGRDGGRDMYAEGPLTWQDPPRADVPAEPDVQAVGATYAVGGTSEMAGGALAASPAPERWAGYTVFQVKQKGTLAARPQDNAAWLWSQVRRELDSWLAPAAGREVPPRQLVFITNVALSPAPGSGGHDHLRQQISGYEATLADSTYDTGDIAYSARLRRLRRFRKINAIRIWDRNALTALLHVHNGVRIAFKALLSVPDVLADLAGVTGALPAHELEEALRRHARSALLSDGRLNFAEAGGDSSTVQVHDVAIDLPVVAGPRAQPAVALSRDADNTDDDASNDNGPHGEGTEDMMLYDSAVRGSLINLVLDQADHVLKPSITTQRSPRHLILTGAPGNGKSTISRFLTQAYRAALLRQAANLGTDHLAVVHGTRDALARFNRDLPRHPRWPIRIDLAEYAEERGHLIDDTLIRWIGEKVNATSHAGTVGPRAVSTWQKKWPWFVVLDGLDEVTEPGVRAKVIERVIGFVNDAEGDDCDVFVLVTTRPVGYTEDISPAHFRTLSLSDLTPAEAVAYGTSVTNLRLRDDDDRRRAVIRRLRDAAESESFRHLLRTPLQVLILTIIIDSSAGNLAPDRFSLFWGYYSTVFTRERNKRTALRGLLRDHGPQITKLHERVGFELQRRSEDGERSFAALTEDELRRIIRDILADAGHKPGAAGDDLHHRIFTAATQRLVLIAPRGQHGFGFDVRPLQELSAARYLTNGQFDTVAERLRAIAANPHWRNTWIFAAGRIFAQEQDHLLPRLATLVESIDADAAPRLGHVVPIGPRLALDLLDDGMTRAWPLYSDRLLKLGLKVLHEPTPPDLPSITRVLLRFADTGSQQRGAVVAGIREMLSGTIVTRTTVQRMLSHDVQAAELEVNVRLATRGLHAIRRDFYMRIAADPIADWLEFAAEIDTAPVIGCDLELVRHIAGAIQSADGVPASASWPADLRAALATVAGAEVLQAALTHVVPARPQLHVAIRDLVLPEIARAPARFDHLGGPP